jgi:hypothetical protein
MNRTLAILLALLIIGLTSLALSDEPVLLRYRLEPGDAQVYDTEAKLNMSIKAVEQGIPQKISSVVTMRLPFSIHGTERGDDGTMGAEVRFHGLNLDMQMAQGNEQMRITADEQGLKMARNGSTVASGSWGSPGLGGMPDLSKLLDVTIGARFNDRAELVEVTNLDALNAQFQGLDFGQVLDNQVVYPEDPVGPGDSWEHELSQSILNATLPGGPVTMTGTARYTVIARVTHRNRECLELAIEAAFDTPEAARGMDLQQTVEGTAFVDIATGVPLDVRLDLTQHLAGTVEGVEFTLDGNGTITLTYTGGNKKYTELVRAEADAHPDALSTLHVPMVTENTVKINGASYAKGDVVSLGGDDYAVVAFKSTALKLHRQSDSAVYQIGLGTGGRVTYVKLLGYAK